RSLHHHNRCGRTRTLSRPFVAYTKPARNGLCGLRRFFGGPIFLRDYPIERAWLACFAYAAGNSPRGDGRMTT
ncbi:MAG TPA: hypothetical protein VGY53_01200, partial [Isosphaeraceae bacterium]|nr:hypothetical protein [Isosphaeraceae bacterium]